MILFSDLATLDRLRVGQGGKVVDMHVLVLFVSWVLHVVLDFGGIQFLREEENADIRITGSRKYKKKSKYKRKSCKESALVPLESIVHPLLKVGGDLTHGHKMPPPLLRASNSKNLSP